MTQKKLLISAAIVVAGIAWYAFRPELLFVTQAVNESFPAMQQTRSGANQSLAQGRFHGVAHETQGTASIIEVDGGKRVLRLTDFETSNGPDVRVFLVAAPDANDNDTVKNAGYIEVGKLKGNVGDQNYDVPTNVDLTKYRAVTIWCNRFGVNFGTAPLMATDMSPRPLAQGDFHGVAHATRGTATILEVDGGKRVLRLTDFETSNGPDVRVFLTAAGDANDNDTVRNAGYIELGKLKGNVGDQNYDVPATADLSKYRSVTIWCNRFGVNFGTAPLMSSQQMSSGMSPRALAQGEFHGVAHETHGMATIHEVDGGKRLLRLTDFQTSNGPDVRVFLIAAGDANDNDTVTKAGYIELGKLKGNVGDQNYDIPANVDLKKYRAVTIWCNRFGVNFATAPLQSPAGVS